MKSVPEGSRAGVPKPFHVKRESLSGLMRKALSIARERGPAALVARIFRKLVGLARGRAWERRKRRERRRDLELYGSLAPLRFDAGDAPFVSIIVFTEPPQRYLAACLRALRRYTDSSISTELIVVRRAQPAGDVDFLASCSGVRVVTLEGSANIANAANAGAKAARGTYLHFLAADALVAENWLRPLVTLIESDARIGSVGSQLRDSNDLIEEAGAVVWSDAQASNYCAGRPKSEAGSLYVREVDYSSMASLMVRSASFALVGGFSSEFEDGYYADVDLCFKLRELGLRTMYQPESVVAHLDLSPPHQGIGRGQEAARNRFLEKWETSLRQHTPPDPDCIDSAARRLAGSKTVLVMDSVVPQDDRDAGARRLIAIMRLMRELDHHVVFIPHDAYAPLDVCRRLRSFGIEVREHTSDAFDELMHMGVRIDLAWLSRPMICRRYLPFIRSRLNAPVIYDTVDLHYLRMERQERIEGIRNMWQEMRALEFSLAADATLTVVTSEWERTLLESSGISARVLPIIETIDASHVGRAGRSGLLFLGNYTHAPNVDAAFWLASEILPRVQRRIPDIVLTLAGFDPPAAIRRLSSDRIIVTGHVPDLRTLFHSARAFVAPLRYGAGMKGKIVQSLAHALPVVTTNIGAEGIGLVDGIDALIASDEDSFADAAVRLYSDDILWDRLAAGALEAAARFTPSSLTATLAEILTNAVEADQALSTRTS